MAKHKKVSIRKIENDMGYKMQILLFAYLMDELGYDANRIIEVKKALDRYLNTIDQHLISVRKVEEIIYENTGLQMVKK